MNTAAYFKVIRFVLFFLTILINGCDSRLTYKGDGILDNGIIFYPTFRVVFREIEVSNSSTTSFKFKGLPNDELSFRLELSGINDSHSDNSEAIAMFKEMDTAKTRIRVELLNETTTLKQVELSEITNNWKFASLGDVRFFWHRFLIDLKFDSDVQYWMRISIKTEGTILHKIYLTPILEGGGFGKGEIHRS